MMAAKLKAIFLRFLLDNDDDIVDWMGGMVCQRSCQRSRLTHHVKGHVCTFGLMSHDNQLLKKLLPTCARS